MAPTTTTTLIPILFAVDCGNAQGALRKLYVVATDMTTANTLAASKLAAGWTITGLSVVAGYAGSPTLTVQAGI